jgi:hypothetical protein
VSVSPRTPRYAGAVDDDRLVITLARLDTARAALAEATGGGALCHIDDDQTGRLLEVKRREGAAVALADARDALRLAAPGADPLPAEIAWWESQLADHREQGQGADWIAYAEGGVSALHTLRHEIEAAGS